MGRPKLYHTQVDRQRAMQGYRKTYYEKNRQRISERNKKKYRERQGHAVIDGKERLNALPSESSPLSPLKKVPKGRASPRSSSTVVRELEATLMAVIGGSLTSFMDRFICDAAHSPSLSSCLGTLCSTLEQVEDMEKHIRSVHAQVLQEKGVGHELQTVEVTAQRVKHVAHAIEDILLHGASESTGALLNKQVHKELHYQNSPDIAPLSSM
ncbi:hypothetical protein HYDPIDRAFT_34493 [Hydnomerulius pinastri MD-312]|uniref:Uncharacterized protein n=1 Tax=Hydnomerulius pinastri MD-312 TaxID=994086 RepID=A0A0C9W616_9AGAM|nr:hypothetical protein HYDPIDRAFT_34493 [Hydnomerulius pinastri MD-312]